MEMMEIDGYDGITEQSTVHGGTLTFIPIFHVLMQAT